MKFEARITQEQKARGAAPDNSRDKLLRVGHWSANQMFTTITDTLNLLPDYTLQQQFTGG